MNRTRSFTSAILISILIASCNSKSESQLEEIIELGNYPSASAVEYLDGTLYIIGDDAPQLLMLDKNFVVKDSMLLYASREPKLSKDIKPDNESITVFRKNAETVLYIFGSGSLSPYRNMYQVIIPALRDHQADWMDTLYKRILQSGPSELNIEGAAYLDGYLCLSNRGHKAYPKNHLFFITDSFPGNSLSAGIHVAEITGSADTSSFSGVSGMTYSEKDDRLLLTVSTEDTRSSYEDGAIGKSYIWFIDSISSKTSAQFIQPSHKIDLEDIDRRFKGQKIESLCILEETGSHYVLVLVADNDNGSSSIFRLRLAK